MIFRKDGLKKLSPAAAIYFNTDRFWSFNIENFDLDVFL
jgi:hypothetical protein